MPRFFFHVRLGRDLTLDKRGIELTDLAEVRRKVREDARETAISGDKGFHEQQFVITDENGMIVFKYAFADASNQPQTQRLTDLKTQDEDDIQGY